MPSQAWDDLLEPDSDDGLSTDLAYPCPGRSEPAGGSEPAGSASLGGCPPAEALGSGGVKEVESSSVASQSGEAGGGSGSEQDRAGGPAHAVSNEHPLAPAALVAPTTPRGPQGPASAAPSPAASLSGFSPSEAAAAVHREENGKDLADHKDREGQLKVAHGTQELFCPAPRVPTPGAVGTPEPAGTCLQQEVQQEGHQGPSGSTAHGEEELTGEGEAQVADRASGPTPGKASGTGSTTATDTKEPDVSGVGTLPGEVEVVAVRDSQTELATLQAGQQDAFQLQATRSAELLAKAAVPSAEVPVTQTVAVLRQVLPNEAAMSEEVRELYKGVKKELQAVERSVQKGGVVFLKGSMTMYQLMSEVTTLARDIYRHYEVPFGQWQLRGEGTAGGKKWSSKIFESQLQALEGSVQALGKLKEELAQATEDLNWEQLQDFQDSIKEAMPEEVNGELEECQSKLKAEIGKTQMMEGEMAAKKAQLGYLQDSKKVVEVRINLVTQRIRTLTEAERGHQQKKEESRAEGAERRGTASRETTTRIDALAKAHSQELDAALAAQQASASKYRSHVDRLEEELVRAAAAPSGNHVVFCLDTSGSMRGVRFSQALLALQAFRAELGKADTGGDRLSLVTFDHAARAHLEHVLLATADLGQVPFSGGGTCYTAAWERIAACARFTLPGHRLVVVFVTDGISDDIPQAVQLAGELYSTHSVQGGMSAVTVGVDGCFESQLKDLVLKANGGHGTFLSGQEAVPLYLDVTTRNMVQQFVVLARNVSRRTEDIKRQLELLEEQDKKSQERCQGLAQRLSDQFKSAAQAERQTLEDLQLQRQAAEAAVQRSLDAEVFNMQGEREQLENELEALKERLRPIDEQMADVRSESDTIQKTLEAQMKNNTLMQEQLAEQEKLLMSNIDLQNQVLQRMQQRMGDVSIKKLLEIRRSVEEHVTSCTQTKVDAEKQVMAIDIFVKCIKGAVKKLQHRSEGVFDERLVDQMVFDYYKQLVGLDIRQPLGDAHNFRVIVEFVAGELAIDKAVVGRVLKRHSLAELIVRLSDEDGVDPRALAKKEDKLVKAFEDAVRSDNPECKRAMKMVARLKTKVGKCEEKVEEAAEKLKNAKDLREAEEKLEKLETTLERAEEEQEKITEELADAEEKLEEARAELSEEDRDYVRLVKAVMKNVNKAAYMKAQDWEMQMALWHLKALHESLLAPAQGLQESAQRQEAALCGPPRRVSLEDSRGR